MHLFKHLQWNNEHKPFSITDFLSFTLINEQNQISPSIPQPAQTESSKPLPVLQEKIYNMVNVVRQGPEEKEKKSFPKPFYIEARSPIVLLLGTLILFTVIKWTGSVLCKILVRRGNALGPVHTKTIVNANASKRIFLSPSTRKRSSFT